MKGQEIRRAFLEFFESKGHRIIKSSPLVPQGDPTLLFANSGMVQFKNVFLGQEDIGTKRATTSQKCLRVSGKHNDFENVGRTPRHHTFFEMLGNFSFGDYFKQDAISFAWEFVTEVIKLPKERLCVSVYEEDDEAFELWQKIAGLPPEKVARLGASENFWAMGDTGPCGPCTEIHWDLDPTQPGGIEEDPERFLEIWNLVFMQFDRDASGEMKPLPAPSVDTGAGLERMASVLQGVPTNFDTDLFDPIRARIQEICGKTYGEDPDATVSMRVICDHCRSTTFLVGDAVLPSNAGRGYVLRRIMRRAARHGVLLGIKEPFLYKLVESVAEAMRDNYPELDERRSYIEKVVKVEEERFLRTLEKGLKLLGDEQARIKADGKDVLDGAFAFKLYDTFGFPLDLTEDIGRSEGFAVDTEGFNKALEIQRVKSSKGGKFDAEAGLGDAIGELVSQGASTKFLGYDAVEADAEIIGIIKHGELVSEAGSGDDVEIVTNRTPFYAEKGGQVGDTGTINGATGHAIVTDTQTAGEGLSRHHAKVANGYLRVGDAVKMEVSVERRDNIRKNHTATHLIHYALHRVIGEDAKQAGSLVAPDRLRFDFTHFSAMSDEEIAEVERIANDLVMNCIPVQTDLKSYDEAVKSGAMALFGEKYGDEVRVVACGPSVELCGGTHVTNSGQIGPILVLGESSVAAGVRRIEAVTGPGAYAKMREALDAQHELARLYKVSGDEVVERVKATAEQVRQMEKEIARLKEKMTESANKDLIDAVQDVGGVKLLAAVAQASDADALRAQAAKLRDKIGSGVVVLGADTGGKAMLCVLVTKDLTDRYQAGKIIGPLAKIVGGGGGGKPDMAQAGGPNPAKLQEAVGAAASQL
ncbi:MAG: alanine--tRNA ligase [Deltaproteobacteria bacterium]|nr:alanine--tRNA ligase [Deltaproteobacteria bacterium]